MGVEDTENILNIFSGRNFAGMRDMLCGKGTGFIGGFLKSKQDESDATVTSYVWKTLEFALGIKMATKVWSCMFIPKKFEGDVDNTFLIRENRIDSDEKEVPTGQSTVVIFDEKSLPNIAVEALTEENQSNLTIIDDALPKDFYGPGTGKASDGLIKQLTDNSSINNFVINVRFALCLFHGGPVHTFNEGRENRIGFFNESRRAYLGVFKIKTSMLCIPLFGFSYKQKEGDENINPIIRIVNETVNRLGQSKSYKELEKDSWLSVKDISEILIKVLNGQTFDAAICFSLIIHKPTLVLFNKIIADCIQSIQLSLPTVWVAVTILSNSTVSSVNVSNSLQIILNFDPSDQKSCFDYVEQKARIEKDFDIKARKAKSIRNTKAQRQLLRSIENERDVALNDAKSKIGLLADIIEVSPKNETFAVLCPEATKEYLSLSLSYRSGKIKSSEARALNDSELILKAKLELYKNYRIERQRVIDNIKAYNNYIQVIKSGRKDISPVELSPMCSFEELLNKTFKYTGSFDSSKLNFSF